jgi:hypothetical protein
VIFSNHWFEPKVTQGWRNSSEQELVILFWWGSKLRSAGLFGKLRAPTCPRAALRSRADKYTHLGIPSDQVYVVFAERLGGNQAPATAGGTGSRCGLPGRARGPGSAGRAGGTRPALPLLKPGHA